MNVLSGMRSFPRAWSELHIRPWIEVDKPFSEHGADMPAVLNFEFVRPSIRVVQHEGTDGSTFNRGAEASQHGVQPLALLPDRYVSHRFGLTVRWTGSLDRLEC
jgi:hypothetical protein